jgi:phosphate:Na+ symporter
MFHTIFNLINISLMIWFTNLYVKIVTKLIPSKPSEEENETHLKFISTGMLSTAELSILQAHNEIVLYSQRTQRMLGLVRELYHETDEAAFVKKFSRIQKYENISDRMEVEIATYLTKVADGRLSNESKHQIQMNLRIVSEIESVADSCYNLARTIQRGHEGKVKFTDDVNANIELMFNLVESAIVQMSHILEASTLQISDINKTQNLENEINNFRNQLKTQHIVDVNDAKYPYASSVIYMDMIVECEKMGDYIVNVVEALADSKLYKVNAK